MAWAFQFPSSFGPLPLLFFEKGMPKVCLNVLPGWETAAFGFCATVLFGGIAGPIALKGQAEQVQKDGFYVR